MVREVSIQLCHDSKDHDDRDCVEDANPQRPRMASDLHQLGWDPACSALAFPHFNCTVHRRLLLRPPGMFCKASVTHRSDGNRDQDDQKYDSGHREDHHVSLFSIYIEINRSVNYC